LRGDYEHEKPLLTRERVYWPGILIKPEATMQKRKTRKPIKEKDEK
jgi:hypothetical protein